MPKTTIWEIEYPTLETGANVPAVVQATAESVEAALNAATNGILKRVSITTAPNPVTGTSVVVAELKPVAVKAGRLYKIQSQGTFYSNVTNQALQVAIKKGATGDTGTGGVSLSDGAFWTNPDAALVGTVFDRTAYYVPVADETLRFTLVCVRAYGSGTITFQAAPTNPLYFVIEDMGPDPS